MNKNGYISNRAGNLNNCYYQLEPLFENNENEDFDAFNEEVTYDIEGSIVKKKEVKHLRYSSRFRRIWNSIAIAFSVYSALMFPFYAAYHSEKNIRIIIVDTIIDIFFLFEIGLNFKTTFVDSKGVEVFDIKKISKNYLKKYFIIDLISSLPIDKLLWVINYEKYISIITILDFIKIVRLRRIYLVPIARSQMKYILLKVVLTLILAIHIISCWWFIIVSKNKTWKPYQEINMNTDLYNSERLEQYVTLFYTGFWLIFGQNIIPTTTLEIWFSAIFIFSGLFIISFLIGETLIFLSRNNEKNENAEFLLDQSLDFTKNIDMSSELKKSIIEFIVKKYPTLTLQEDFNKLCSYISPELRKEVYECIYSPIFAMNPIFDNDSKLSKFIINRISYKFCQVEEEIITQGAQAFDFYFLVKGKCAVFIKTKKGNKERVCDLIEGSYFGEIGLIYKTYRTATVVSKGYITVGHLNRTEFRVLTNAFPYVIDKLKLGSKFYKDSWKRYVSEIFSQASYFSGLPFEEYSELIYKMKTIKLRQGEFLFKPGERIDKVFAVASGTLELNFVINMKSTYYNSLVYESENNDDKSLMAKLTINVEKKIDAEFQPIVTDDSYVEGEPEISQEILLAHFYQGTLIYPNMVLNKRLHLFHCKASENAMVYSLDLEDIKNLSKEYPDFKNNLREKIEDNYFDYFTLEKEKNFFRNLWVKAIVSVILKNREDKIKNRNKFSDIIAKLKVVGMCIRNGNLKLADDVIDGFVPFKFVTKDCSLDPAVNYPGQLPFSHPIIRNFDSSTDTQSKGSLINQCKSLQKEVNSQLPYVKKCKERLSNCIGLISTLKNEVAHKKK